MRGEAIIDGAGGEQAIGKPSALPLWFGSAADPAPLSDQDVAETLAWRDGDILFDEPLPAAVRVEQNRHLVRKITIIAQLAAQGAARRRTLSTPTIPLAFLLALETTMDHSSQVLPSKK
ncbi:hypothetical protein ACRAWD_32145 [Caulobacter segnis]